MKLTLNQTKLAGLTMQLDLKTREYKKLCEDLESMKELNIDPNSQEYVFLRKEFQRNLDEITSIKNQLKELEEKN